MQHRGLKRKISKTVTAGLLISLTLGWIPQQVLAAPVITNMPHRADGSQITGSQPVPRTMPVDVAVKTRPQPSGTANAPAANKPAAQAPTQVAPKAEAPKPATPPTQAAPKAEAPKPETPPTQAAPKAEAPKPAAQAPTQAAPKAEAPKPATPPTQAAPKAEAPKPATPPTQAAPKAEAPKPATPPTQAAPKAEAPKPATSPTQAAPKAEAPKPATPPTQAAPKAEAPKPATPAQTVPKPAVKTTPGGLPTKPPGLETKKPAQAKPAAPAKKEKAKKPAKPAPEKSVYQVGDKGWKIKQAQQYLQKLGYDPGGTDGKFTKTTRKSIRNFQKKYKLKETGNLDNATYEELKWQAEARDYGGNVASTKILKTAAQYKGVPYVFGGTTPNGFDCSGYVQYVFAKNGIRLTRTADTQALEGKYVSKKSLRPGDLVFFTTYEPGASHVGIYAGNNQFWNATSSRGIMLSNLNDSYWGPRYYTARRILTSR